MSQYVELPIEQIEIDCDNPRIAHYLVNHNTDDEELLAVLKFYTIKRDEIVAKLRKK